MLLVFAAVYLSIGSQTYADDRPFWTETSSFVEGDRVYFVGVCTNATNIEEGRKSALENAKSELSNYLQISDLSGITFETQNTYEKQNRDKKTFSVYRLMFVRNDIIKKFREEKSVKRKTTELQVNKLNLEIEQIKTQEKELKEKQNDLESIKKRISALSAATAKLTSGMTTGETINVLGPPRSREECEANTYYNFGSYWLVFKSGILACRVKTEKFQGGCGDACIFGERY